MARSELLKRLFGAYTRGDDGAFRAVATEIIEDERRKQHGLLAEELRHALSRDDRRPGARDPLIMHELPKDRDDRRLLSLSKPAKEMDELVLTATVRELLFELVEENRSRSLLSAYALRPRQRLLFVGASGTGKSTSAHALAAELSLPVATVSLAALTSSYLGETGRNVERIVRFAEMTPCVLLFDEFDSVGSERGKGSDHGELRRVVASVLQLMEQMQGESLFVATSNHPGLLDTAIMRRFDEIVGFGRLDVPAIAELIRLKLQAAPNRVGAARWAAQLELRSPAEVEAICRDALRRWVLSATPVLTDAQFAMAVARMDGRSTALQSLGATTL